MYRTLLRFWRTAPCGGYTGPSFNVREKGCIRTNSWSSALQHLGNATEVWQSWWSNGTPSNKSASIRATNNPDSCSECHTWELTATPLLGCPDSWLQTQMTPGWTLSMRLTAFSTPFWECDPFLYSSGLLCGMWLLRPRHIKASARTWLETNPPPYPSRASFGNKQLPKRSTEDS